MRNAELTLTQEWDKTFPLSDKVDHSKVTFHNRYGITLAADLYKPKGAVANQGRGGRQARGDSRVRPLRRREGAVLGTLCADHGGARFLTIAFDPSYCGESGGEPRYMASPDINTEDFMAAVDYLSCRGDVDMERIGIIGICGWGGLALKRGCARPTHQSDSGEHHVRYEPHCCQGVFRRGG